MNVKCSESRECFGENGLTLSVLESLGVSHFVGRVLGGRGLCRSTQAASCRGQTPRLGVNRTACEDSPVSSEVAMVSGRCKARTETTVAS